MSEPHAHHPTALPVVLASASPRRRGLLAFVLADFTVSPTHADEGGYAHLPAPEVPRMLALRKAEAAALHHPSALIIAADTVVVRDGEILNKPVGSAEAVSMLLSLAGRSHDVITGVALSKPLAGGGRETMAFTTRTEVTFGALTPGAAAAYAAGGSPLDKAGGYGIQDPEMARWVEKIHGDFYNVVGFPVFDFYHHLLNFCPECLASHP